MLLRGEFERWPGGSHRIGPRADVFAAYPHAVYLPAGVRFVSGLGGLGNRRLPRLVTVRPEKLGLAPRVIGRATAATRFAAAATRRGRSSTSCRRRFRPTVC